jgi:hypothetical protein
VERTRGGGPGDRGDIVLGWLTRLTVVLGLVGLVGFDAISLGVGRLATEDAAHAAAGAAVRSWADTQDVQRAYEAALSELDPVSGLEGTIPPSSFSIAPDGAVTLTLERTSATMLVEKVPPIRSWATSRATVTRSSQR